MKFYFNSLIDAGEKSGEINYVRPNKNCNLSSWMDGCEPGWACTVGKEQKINLQDAKDIPYRALDCQACCPGFFCPHGLTCMIREFPRLALATPSDPKYNHFWNSNFCTYFIPIMGIQAIQNPKFDPSS
jgi:hypothetical protein